MYIYIYIYIYIHLKQHINAYKISQLNWQWMLTIENLPICKQTYFKYLFTF